MTFRFKSLDNDYICANFIEGVGTLSELNINFTQNNDITIVKGTMVLEINGGYVLGYVNISSMDKKKYYDFIRFLGLQYEYVSKVDNQPYILSNPLVQCYNGSIKVDYKKVLIIQSTTPSKIYFVGRLNEHSININYSTKIENCEEYIRGNIQGVWIENEGVLGLYKEYQQLIPLDLNNANLTHNKVYTISIHNTTQSYKVKFVTDNIKNSGEIYDSDFITESYNEYLFNKKARINRQKK